MKKLFVLIMVSVMGAMYGFAQDSLLVSQPGSVMLARAGDVYYLGNERMDKKTTEKWLKQQDCLVAYDLFHSGFTTAKIGWIVMGSGILLDIIGGIYMGVAYKKESLQGILDGWTLCGLGAGLELASVPVISVGYYKMHQTVGVYNTYCYKGAHPRPYWALQVSGNGIGLAYKF
jgi:hypothetical protein